MGDRTGEAETFHFCCLLKLLAVRIFSLTSASDKCRRTRLTRGI